MSKLGGGRKSAAASQLPSLPRFQLSAMIGRCLSSATNLTIWCRCAIPLPSSSPLSRVSFIGAVNLPSVFLPPARARLILGFVFARLLSKVIRNIHLMNTLAKSLIHAPKEEPLEPFRKEMCFVFLGTKLTKRKERKHEGNICKFNKRKTRSRGEELA